ncbi:UNVERIFIED_CONTAM: mzt2b [Trichonephila clavipes]
MNFFFRMNTLGSNQYRAVDPKHQELYELCRISGMPLDRKLFEILVELLRVDVSPSTLFDVLKNMTNDMSNQVVNQNLVSKKNSQNRTPPVLDKKKPPVAAKPKKIRVENSNLITFRN